MAPRRPASRRPARGGAGRSELLELRVIGGSARGRRISAPAAPEIRPTSHRVREAIFDVLGHLQVLPGAVVCDLFAGSGALGIEALSRGAERAIFVERDARFAQVIEENLAATALGAGSSVLRGEVGSVLSSPAYRSLFDEVTICLADPPYGYERWPELVELLPGELVVLESDRELELGSRLELYRTYHYGTTLVTVATTRAATPTGGLDPTGGAGR